MKSPLKNISLAAALIPLWLVAGSAPASAAVSEVFTKLQSDPVSCEVRTTPAAEAGQRWCQGSLENRARSFDGTPVDVNFAMPPEPATGPDGNFPVVGLFHGWGGSKAGLSAGNAQEFLQRGYAVFSMTDRGWFNSCGTAASRAGLPAWATCANGYVHLIDQRWEVRDAQYLLGVLVDDGVIDPNRIGAFGGSYGGMMSLQLAMLKNRVKLPDGTYAPWTSPAGVPISLRVAVPQNLASNLAYALMPNGSFLDYVAKAPYFGPNGDLRVGADKTQIMLGLYTGGLNKAYFPDPGQDPSADMISWVGATARPGPYDNEFSRAVINEIATNHSADGVDDSVAPAPVFMSAGYRDDFVPVSETIRIYNKIRADHPEVPVQLFFSDQGHNRSRKKSGDARALDPLRDAWFDYYLLGQGSKPQGGVTTMSMTCPNSAVNDGPFHFTSWATMQQGEIRLRSAASQTISPSGTMFGGEFSPQTDDPCVSVAATDNLATANYRLPAAGAGGYTLAGPATVIARLKVTGESDQVVSRLLDVAQDGTETLLERGILRPIMNGGEGRQVWQLHPNFTKIAEGHRLKLELLPEESPYSHINTATSGPAAQQPIEVTDLELRIPVSDPPGSAGSQVKPPAPKFLPPGYTLSRDFSEAPAPDSIEPATRVTSGPARYTAATGARVDFDASGESAATFECRFDTDSESDWAPCSSPWQSSGLALGYHRLQVRAIDESGNVDSTPAESVFTIATQPNTIKVGKLKRVIRTGKRKAKVKVRFRSNLKTATFQCRVDRHRFSRCRSPRTYRLGKGRHVIQVRAVNSGVVDPTPVKWVVRVKRR